MVGSFEMDMGDGEVRYTGGVDYKGGVLSRPMIGSLLDRCIATADKYYRGIMRVVYGGTEPARAIEEIESPNSCVIPPELLVTTPTTAPVA